MALCSRVVRFLYKIENKVTCSEFLNKGVSFGHWISSIVGYLSRVTASCLPTNLIADKDNLS